MNKITRITAPKFKIGKFSLNEYELRQLMLEVAQGLQLPYITVKDSKGVKALILCNGALSNNLFGMDITGKATLAMIGLRRVANGITIGKN